MGAELIAKEVVIYGGELSVTVQCEHNEIVKFVTTEEPHEG